VLFILTDPTLGLKIVEYERCCGTNWICLGDPLVVDVVVVVVFVEVDFAVLWTNLVELILSAEAILRLFTIAKRVDAARGIAVFNKLLLLLFSEEEMEKDWLPSIECDLLFDVVWVCVCRRFELEEEWLLSFLLFLMFFFFFGVETELSEDAGDEFPLPKDPTNNADIKATGANMFKCDGVVDLSLLELTESFVSKTASSWRWRSCN